MRQRSKLHWSTVVCRPWAIVVYNVEPTLGQRRNAIWAPGVRRSTTSRQERRKQTEDPRHSIYSHEPVNKRMKSRNSFVHSVTALDTNPPAERTRAWIHHLRSVPQKLKSTPSDELGPGSEGPWLHWKCLNRLRTGMDHC